MTLCEFCHWLNQGSQGNMIFKLSAMYYTEYRRFCMKLTAERQITDMAETELNWFLNQSEYFLLSMYLCNYSGPGTMISFSGNT